MSRTRLGRIMSPAEIQTSRPHRQCADYVSLTGVEPVASTFGGSRSSSELQRQVTPICTDRTQAQEGYLNLLGLVFPCSCIYVVREDAQLNHFWRSVDWRRATWYRTKESSFMRTARGPPLPCAKSACSVADTPRLGVLGRLSVSALHTRTVPSG